MFRIIVDTRAGRRSADVEPWTGAGVQPGGAIPQALQLVFASILECQSEVTRSFTVCETSPGKALRSMRPEHRSRL